MVTARTTGSCDLVHRISCKCLENYTLRASRANELGLWSWTRALNSSSRQFHGQTGKEWICDCQYSCTGRYSKAWWRSISCRWQLHVSFDF